MTTNTKTQALTVAQLKDQGFEVGTAFKKAVYLLADGSLWDGGYDYAGKRGVYHRDVEVFTVYGILAGSKFWEEVATELELVMILPEEERILIHPEQVVTEAQRQKLYFAKWLGFTVEEM